MCQIQSCGIQSLAPYFLNPKKKESSPYGVEVSKSLEEYLQSTDPEIMNFYLKKMCLVIAEILKRQRGNQYGFGDVVNSDDFIMNNMDDTMLDDTDATHTKPVENFFGIMDREIKKTGPQGFAKVSDDLIKYARDLVVGDYQWWSKTNRKKAKELKEKEAEFSALQQELIKSDVDEQDSVKLTESNQVLKCIASCKKSHNGPVTTVDELKLLVATWDSTEKVLHIALNLEIRLRKLTFTNVKATCPLFCQKGLTIDQKVRNIERLIGTQLDMQVTATMEDLESAILECSKSNEVEEPEQQIQEMTCDEVTTQHNPDEVENGEYENSTSVMWPPN